MNDRMSRERFAKFAEGTLEEALCLAERQSGKTLPRTIAFSWMGANEETIHEGIVETIVDRVYIDEDHIYPCVDLGVGDLLDDGTPVIIANVAGYAPKPFGKNWTGREGPFVRMIGHAFMEKIQGKPYGEGRVFAGDLVDMRGVDNEA